MFRIFIIICVIFPNILFSQIQNTSYNYLNTHSSSRILAMGGDVISIFDNDVSLANFTPSLLNEKMDQVHSIEKIYLRDHLRLRHFITNSKNELYEDKDGNIYVSADKIGIYKISFVRFRN